MTIREASKFRALNRMTEAVVQRDLSLLKRIDQTVDALSEDREAMDVLADAMEPEIARIKDIPNVIDTDGKIVPMLERTRDSLGNYHSLMKRKCEIARHAPELHPDDGVVEAYCSAMDAVARLHNAFNALCWAIGEHDADFDEAVPGGPYKTSDDLFAALGV